MSRPNRFRWFAAALLIVAAVAQAIAGVWWLALLAMLLAAVVLLSPVLRSRWFGAFSTTALVVGMVWSVTVGLWVQAAFLAIVVWLGLRQDLPRGFHP
ncbi:MAG: hypothetical protein R3C39_02230 [Dehalococcoidia bacterium]